MLIGTLIAHHTHTANRREENSTCLPDLVVERNLDLAILHISRNTSGQHLASLFATQLHLVITQSANIDIISILQDTYLLRRDIAQDTHSQTRTREGVTGNQVFGHAQLATYTTHLVLKQPLQGLTQLQMHLLRQTAYIMMALDHLAGDVQRLDTVGIDRALSQPFGIGNLLGLGIEYLDEVATDDLSLLLWIGHASQIGKELCAGIHTDHVQAQHLVILHDLSKLVLTEHTMIHEDTCQVTTNGTIEQDGSDRRIHATGKTEDHTVVTQLCLQLCHRGVDKRSGTPLLTAATDINHEVLQQLLTLQGVEHLGVELHGPNRLSGAGKSSVGNIGSTTDDLKIFRDRCNRITMAHPYLRVLFKALEERVCGIYRLQVRTAILTGVGLLHLTSQRVGDELRTVADSQHRHPADEL